MKLIERITAAFHQVAYDIVNLYNVSSYIHNSGRVYCYTDKRWVTDSDDNYGVNYYQFTESGAAASNPVIEWEHKGVLLPANTRISKIQLVAHSNSIEITDLEVMIVFRYPTNGANWAVGIASDAAMTNITVHRDFFMNSANSVPMSGDSRYLRKRDIFLNYKTPASGYVSIYFKPVGNITATRYHRVAYTYEFTPNNPNA